MWPRGQPLPSWAPLSSATTQSTPSMVKITPILPSTATSPRKAVLSITKYGPSASVRLSREHRCWRFVARLSRQGSRAITSCGFSAKPTALFVTKPTFRHWRLSDPCARSLALQIMTSKVTRLGR